MRYRSADADSKFRTEKPWNVYSFYEPTKFGKARGKLPLACRLAHEQKLVAAVTDENFVVSETRLDGVCERNKHRVARLMTVKIVINLKVVDVEHGDAHPVENLAVVKHLVVISAVKRAGKRISVRLVARFCNTRYQFGTRDVDEFLVEFFYHFDDVRFAVYFDVARNNAERLVAAQFNLVFLRLSGERFCRNAVFARRRLFPYFVTGARPVYGIARLFASAYFVRRQNAHYREYLSEFFDLFFRLSRG